MKAGKAARVYSINKERLQEALDAVDKLVKSLKKEVTNAQKKC